MPETSGDPQVGVHFQGALSWPGSQGFPSVFSDPAGQHSGVYLWTVESDRGHMVFYVGMTTRPFSVRMREHLSEYLSGMYSIYDISKFREGRRERLWEGMWRKGEEARYPEFLTRHDELWPHLWGMITAMRLHLGAVEGSDERLLKRIEAGIALHLYRQPGRVGNLQDPDLVYHPRRPEEAPIRAEFQSDVPILGLPNQLQI